jgi:two-component system, NtrC family, nitrogen regulation response regulator GlnG
VVERVVSMADGDNISAANLSYVFQEMEQLVEPTERLNIDTSLPFKEAKQKIVELFEKDYLEELLKRSNYNVSRASREAKIDRKHLRNLLKKYDINAPEDDEEE